MGKKKPIEITDQYSVKSVTIMTGINEHTLRAWENRYLAVTPARSASGRRYYTREHVERIRAMMLLCERGHAISTIAGLPMAGLNQLLNAPVVAAVPGARHDEAARVIADLLAAMSAFDLQGFRALLQSQLNSLGGRAFVLEVVSPLMSAFGDMTAGGGVTIAQEHAASALVKSALFELFFTTPDVAAGQGPREGTYLFATMEGDHHDLGILCAAVLARMHGHPCVFIGANTPPDALALAANAVHAAVIVIGAVEIPHSLLPRTRRDYLRQLQDGLVGRCRIVVGTSSAAVTGSLAGHRGVTVVSSLAEFQGRYCAG